MWLIPFGYIHELNWGMQDYKIEHKFTDWSQKQHLITRTHRLQNATESRKFKICEL